MRGSVYVCDFGGHVVKVGRSSCPMKHINRLQLSMKKHRDIQMTRFWVSDPHFECEKTEKVMIDRIRKENKDSPPLTRLNEWTYDIRYDDLISVAEAQPKELCTGMSYYGADYESFDELINKRENGSNYYRKCESLGLMCAIQGEQMGFLPRSQRESVTTCFAYYFFKADENGDYPEWKLFSTKDGDVFDKIDEIENDDSQDFDGRLSILSRWFICESETDQFYRMRGIPS